MKFYPDKPFPKTDFSRSKITEDETKQIMNLMKENIGGFIELDFKLGLTKQYIEVWVNGDFSLREYSVQDLLSSNEINVDELDLEDMEDVLTIEDFIDLPVLKSPILVAKYIYIRLVYSHIPVAHNFRIPLGSLVSSN